MPRLTTLMTSIALMPLLSWFWAPPFPPPPDEEIDLGDIGGEGDDQVELPRGVSRVTFLLEVHESLSPNATFNALLEATDQDISEQVVGFLPAYRPRPAFRLRLSASVGRPIAAATEEDREVTAPATLRFQIDLDSRAPSAVVTTESGEVIARLRLPASLAQRRFRVVGVHTYDMRATVRALLPRSV